ncbi:zinc finger, CCHC-type containing protein [Tanacetum coccineum]
MATLRFRMFKEDGLKATVNTGKRVVLHEDQQDFLTDRLEEMEDCDDLQLQTTSSFKADHVDAYDSDCDDEVLYVMFATRAENIKRMGHDIVQDSIWEQNDDSEEDQEEDGDDGDTFDMWDITVEDVEHIRKFFNIPDEIDEIIQPLIPEPIHNTPPNDDYVAPATKLILDELLEEFKDEILNVTMVNEGGITARGQNLRLPQLVIMKYALELTTSRALEKVLIREEAKSPVTKNVNSISLARGEEERNDNDVLAADGGINGTDTKMPVKEAEKKIEAGNGTKNKPIKRAEREETAEASSSQPVGYYLKHRINEAILRKKGKTYNLLPMGHVYEAILRKKITRKEDIGGNFEIPCNIGGLKRMNSIVDQGSDRVAKDVLVYVAAYVYPVDFVILDIKEDEKRPFILGTPFLTMAKAVIKFDKGTITLRSGKSKISFHRIPKSLCKVGKGIKNNIEPIAPTMSVNRLVLEWEKR